MYLRGYASSAVWSVCNVGGKQYLAERIVNGGRESYYVTAHCLTCAKAEVLTKYGGRVDLRGWHLAEPHCGAFLKALQRGLPEETNEQQQ